MVTKVTAALLGRFATRMATGVTPMVVLFGMSLLSLYFLGNSAENLERFGRFYVWLLAANALGLLIMLILIGINTWNLISQFRRRAAGSRLTAKLVIMFVVLTLVPVTIVYSFSVRFLRSGIDSWFDVQVEQALESALELSRDSLGAQMRTLQRITTNMTPRLEYVDADMAVSALSDLRMESDASELTLMTLNNRVIATSSEEEIGVIPNRPDEAVMAQLKAGEAYVGLDLIENVGMHIRVVVPVNSNDPLAPNQVLQALYPITRRLSSLADDVQLEFTKYQQLTFLREPLKVSFILTLSLVLLLSVLTAVWAAFQAARRLMLPIHDLAEGTQAVADGDYSTRLSASGRDELGFLVRSFNDMTTRLARARDETRISQLQVESQRTYLQAVLARVSTGVLTLDSKQFLRTANQAAATILEVELEAHIDQALPDLIQQFPQLEQFFAALAGHLSGAAEEWNQEIEFFGREGRRVLVCRGTGLPASEDDLGQGYVLVFDDITTMIRAQRDAAWSEVARRLAHEIKNPLTPIQLSAERLRKKYLDKMPPEDAKVLDRATHTIVQQVEAMKSMVKAFAEYASTPHTRFEDVDINQLIQDVAELYEGMQELRIELELDVDLPLLRADPSRLRQLLHNLIKNALEALRTTEGGWVRCQTQQVHIAESDYAELSIIDNGPGIPEDLHGRLFEPYVTSKTKGGGLGLAVVKKIVEEHNGIIRALNREQGGAQILIQFPLNDLKSHGFMSSGRHRSIETLMGGAK